MNKSSLGKIAAGGVGVVAIGLIVAYASGVFNMGFTDGGVDVRNTKCEQLASARAAVTAELAQRTQAAQTALTEEKDAISDEYWAQNRQLEDQYHECISAALTADPCKEAFEEVGRLYEEIMADFAADKGFNEAKFQEREQAKEKYNKCVEDAQKPEFYEGKKAECDTALAVGRDANQKKRVEAEQAAQARHDAAVATANDAYKQKMAILDAIEEKCKEPGGNTNLNVGAINTGGTGTEIQQNSSACTGVFAGNDDKIQKQISDLENQLQKARAGGMSDGLFGADNIQEALDRLRQELRDSERTCKVDADCGDPVPVCCSETQVGRVYCDNGTCAAEKTDCIVPEICAGKPAQCVAPDTGVRQQEGVYISRTIPETGPCSQNLQIVSLKQATPDSVRYAIVGNIPDWLNIDKPGGSLPGQVTVTYSCGTVQGFGPGTYNVNGSITVYSAANELINTIPFNVSITVTGTQKMIDVIEYGGKLIPISELYKFTGPECDKDEHWHANQGSAKALDGTVVVDSSDCGFGKTKDTPIKSVPDTRPRAEVFGPGDLKSN